jgi:hypothetical protein
MFLLEDGLDRRDIVADQRVTKRPFAGAVTKSALPTLYP